jgi:hypothetical protein
LITLVLFFGLAPAIIAESDEIEYIDVDLAYLYQHIEEFVGMSVRTNGTVEYYSTTCMGPEDFWIEKEDPYASVIVDIDLGNLSFPPRFSFVVVEGWVGIEWNVECGLMYLIYADSCTVLLVGDMDGDLDVDWFDFGIFAQAYGTSIGQSKYHRRCDLDHDGHIDWSDFGIFAANYGKSV